MQVDKLESVNINCIVSVFCEYMMYHNLENKLDPCTWDGYVFDTLAVIIYCFFPSNLEEERSASFLLSLLARVTSFYIDLLLLGRSVVYSTL